MNNLISIIVPFIGSLLGGGVVGYFLDFKRWKKTKYYEFKEQQILKLYSPVQYYLDLSNKISLHIENIFKVSNNYYQNSIKNIKKPEVLKKVSDIKGKHFDKSLDVISKFNIEISSFQDKIALIVKKYLYLSDPDDKDLFENIVFDTYRKKLECDEKGKHIIDFNIQSKLDPIYIYKKEYLEKIENKINEKKRKLYKLKEKLNK